MSDLILNWCFSLPSFIPGSTLERIFPVCIKYKDDFIIIPCERYKPVVEAVTETFDCQYRCWFLGHLLAEEPFHLPGLYCELEHLIWCPSHLLVADLPVQSLLLPIC